MTNSQYWSFWGLAMLVFAMLVTVLIWQLHELNSTINAAVEALKRTP